MSDAEIRIQGREIVVRAADEKTATAIKSAVASSWSSRHAAGVIPATPHGALELATALKGHTATVDQEVRELAKTARRGLAAAPHKRIEKPAPIPGLKTRSWHHQGRGYFFALENPAVMLGMDMGTGKSLTVVGLAEADQAERVLVICPRNCLGVWRREFRAHAERPWIVWNGQVPKRGGGFKRNPPIAARAKAAQEELERAELAGQPIAIVVNYEAFAQGAMAELIKATDWQMIVADESHRLQAPGGKWSTFAAGLDAPRKVCCTGTPFGQTPLTAYAQYRFLDRGIFGTNYQLFQSRYAVTRTIDVDDPRRPGKKRQQEIVVGIRKDMEADFIERFERIAYVCKADDVQTLPDAVSSVRDVELEPETRRIYEELDAEYIAWLRGELDTGEPVTAANALVKATRLMQITSGHAKTESGAIEMVGQEKAKALEQLLEDIPQREPVVVFCRFVEDLNRIQAIAEKTGRRYGELSGRRKDVLTPDATMREDIDVAAVQLQSGGVGIDLTRARIGIYYSLCDSLIQYVQSRKRLHRPGQERAVALIHLLTDAPAERHVYRSLARNENVAEGLLRAAREGWSTDQT